MDDQPITEQTEAAAPGPGDNLPPADANPLRDRLFEKYPDLPKRRDELLDACTTYPDHIEDGDEEKAKRLADFIKQMNAFITRANALHKEEKEPHLRAGQTVDNWWHQLVDSVKEAKAKLDSVRGDYSERKAAEEKRRREEQARLAREEAERKQREAEERQRELEQQLAEERRKREEAERKAEEERQEQARQIEVERKMRLRGVETEEELNALIAEDAEREEEEKRRDDEARRQALRDAEEASRREREWLRSAAKADEEAQRAARTADKAEKKADATQADMGRVRGDYGGMTTLARGWLIGAVDRDELDLEALRQHFGDEAIKSAIWSWVKANAQALHDERIELRGARIVEDVKVR